jgi:hypothetical protein
VTDGQGDIVTVGTLALGFERAFNRLREAIDNEEPADERFLPLFELLNWAASLDDKLNHPPVPVAKGLRWVRNRVQHQWAEALEPGKPVRIEPLPSKKNGQSRMEPMFLTIWLWRPVEGLPNPEKGHEQPELRKAYETELAGEVAELPLERFLVDLAPHMPDR